MLLAATVGCISEKPCESPCKISVELLPRLGNFSIFRMSVYRLGVLKIRNSVG